MGARDLLSCRAGFFAAATLCMASAPAVLADPPATASSTASAPASTDPHLMPMPESAKDRAYRMKVYEGMWISRIADKIKRHWKPPEGKVGQYKVGLHLEVQLDGHVVSSQISKSSGNAAVDHSLLDAVAQSDPLPTPLEPEAYERRVNLVFQPDTD